MYIYIVEMSINDVVERHQDLRLQEHERDQNENLYLHVRLPYVREI